MISMKLYKLMHSGSQTLDFLANLITQQNQHPGTFLLPLTGVGNIVYTGAASRDVPAAFYRCWQHCIYWCSIQGRSCCLLQVLATLYILVQHPGTFLLPFTGVGNIVYTGAASRDVPATFYRCWQHCIYWCSIQGRSCCLLQVLATLYTLVQHPGTFLPPFTGVGNIVYTGAASRDVPAAFYRCWQHCIYWCSIQGRSCHLLQVLATLYILVQHPGTFLLPFTGVGNIVYTGAASRDVPAAFYRCWQHCIYWCSIQGRSCCLLQVLATLYILVQDPGTFLRPFTGIGNIVYTGAGSRNIPAAFYRCWQHCIYWCRIQEHSCGLLQVLATLYILVQDPGTFLTPFTGVGNIVYTGAASRDVPAAFYRCWQHCIYWCSIQERSCCLLQVLATLYILVQHPGTFLPPFTGVGNIVYTGAASRDVPAAFYRCWQHCIYWCSIQERSCCLLQVLATLYILVQHPGTFLPRLTGVGNIVYTGAASRDVPAAFYRCWQHCIYWCSIQGRSCCLLQVLATLYTLVQHPGTFLPPFTGVGNIVYTGAASRDVPAAFYRCWQHCIYWCSIQECSYCLLQVFATLYILVQHPGTFLLPFTGVGNIVYTGAASRDVPATSYRCWQHCIYWCSIQGRSCCLLQVLATLYILVQHPGTFLLPFTGVGNIVYTGAGSRNIPAAFYRCWQHCIYWCRIQEHSCGLLQVLATLYILVQHPGTFLLPFTGVGNIVYTGAASRDVPAAFYRCSQHRIYWCSIQGRSCCLLQVLATLYILVQDPGTFLRPFTGVGNIVYTGVGSRNIPAAFYRCWQHCIYWCSIQGRSCCLLQVLATLYILVQHPGTFLLPFTGVGNIVYTGAGSRNIPAAFYRCWQHCIYWCRIQERS
ncbi:uncharacterized protein LOC124112387 [Haliotis rufescens]|uniref:uncharacterized protein LOC124112387 n=1 Tax=Haliotis rufescens TaxID=6454 RepID=UPI00201FA6B4|nr:uncharacterized protein LOC124112387 [Haliotis rufescens]XP_048239393.1 uncharacterized protein LOC124112387 [Haliotis rufescens]